jgi:multiple sugar transport system substrate-binding protein
MKSSRYVLLMVLFVVLSMSAIALGKTQITIWCLSFDPHINGYTAVNKAFMELNPDIEVILEPQPGQAELGAKMRAALAAGGGAELFSGTGTQILEWAVPGSIQPLTPDVFPSVDWVKENLSPEYYLQCNLNDQIWAVGIPDPPGDTGILVNVDHLNEAGLAVEKAFVDTDQLIDYAKKLAQYDTNGDLIRSGLSFQESNDPTYLLSYIADQGGKFWDNDKQVFTFQIPEAKNALQFFYDLFFVHKVDSINMPNTGDALVQNLASMAFMWPEYLPFTEITYPDMKFDFIMKPAFVKGQKPLFSHSDTWDLLMPSYVSGEKKEAAVKYLQYLASAEGQLVFLEENPGLPTPRSLWDNDYFKTGKGAYLEPVIDAMKEGSFRYWGPFPEQDTLLYNIWWPSIDAMIHGELTVDQTLEQMEVNSNQQVATMKEKYPNVPATFIYWDGLPEDLAIK